MVKKTHSELLPLLQELKDTLKKTKTIQDMCSEYGVDVDFIDLVPMAFADLDVSARTDKGCIYFNYDLLENGFDHFIEENSHYGAHELMHMFQQCFSDGPTQGSDDESYLDNEYEQEGFQAQTEYLSETRDDEEAEEYIEKVLDHHDVKGKEREERKKDLLNLASKLEG